MVVVAKNKKRKIKRKPVAEKAAQPRTLLEQYISISEDHPEILQNIFTF